MKTNHLLLMAITALLTAGCSQNEIMEVSPDAAPPVGFNVYATAQTRGTITDNNAGTTGIKNTTGFGVLAYHTKLNSWNNTSATFTPNFMYNQQVKFNSSWSYTPVKYWPNTEGEKISFFAYAPYESSPTNGSSKGVILSENNKTGAPTLRFTLKANAPDGLIDLVATNAGHNTGENQVINVTKRTTAVKFKFDHVLTRLNFKAKLDATPASGTHIFVTDMRLLGSSNNSGSAFYSAATYKFADGKWDYSASGATAPTPQLTDYPVKAIMPLTSQTSVVTKYNTPGIKITSTTTGDNLLTTSPAAHYLFLIPPTNDATGVAKDKVKVQIDYDIVTIDSKLVDGFSKTSTTATVSLPEGTMLRNTAYNYIFTIGLEEVKISAEVTNWVEPTVNVAIPSVDATKATSSVTTTVAIGNAITALNTTKASNPNCNYFVVNVPFTATAASTSLTATTTNFKSGDKIELNFTVATTVSNVTLNGWKASGTLSNAKGKIILTKD